MVLRVSILGALACIAFGASSVSLPGFLPPVSNQYAANADLTPSVNVDDAASCGARCVAYGPECISFNLCTSASGFECGISGWSMSYDAASGPCTYYRRILPRDDSPAPRAVQWAAELPPPGAVTLAPGGAIGGGFFRHADQYLRTRDPKDMLYWFAQRAGKSSGGQCFGWGGWIKGSETGNYLMGAGSFLQHVDDAALRASVEMVVAGIRSYQDPSTGWLWAVNETDLPTDNTPDYCLGWVTRGLLDAARAGVPDALAIARDSINTFSNHSLLPFFLPANSGPHPSPERPAGWNNVTDGGYGQAYGHMIYMQEQGTIKHTLMAQSPAGTQADVDMARGLYEEGWWLEGLIAEDLTAIYHRQFFSHNYEVTSFEAMADLYVLTGNTTYLNAVMAAWKMLREHWILPGGSFALNEGSYYPPDSYYIGFTGTRVAAGVHSHGHEESSSDDPYFHSTCMYKPGADEPSMGPLATLRAEARAPAPSLGGPNDKDPPTGELCGNVFWALLNSRFHRLWPTNESFVMEIERSIFNVGLAALGDVGSGGQGPNGTGIRYFANQHKAKQFPAMHASCCEGQGTRLFGSLPSFLFALSGGGAAPLTVSVDIYAESTLAFDLPASCGGGRGSLAVHTAWPQGADGVTLALSLPGACDALTLSLRMPAWLAAPPAGLPVTVNGAAWATPGAPGSYLAVAPAGGWPAGPSTVAFALPMALVSARYTGASQLPPYSRWSFLLGPILLSAEGPWDTPSDSLVMPAGLNPATPNTWLLPANDGNSLHFSVAGAPAITMKPYFEVQAAGEQFSNYPCFVRSSASEPASVAA